MICWVSAMEMLQGVWKQHLRPCVVVGYGVKIFLPSPPNYVTRSPGGDMLVTVSWACENNSGRYQRFFNRFNAVWFGFKNLGNQTNRKRFFDNTTRKNSTNPTNLKRLIPIEHDHGFFKLIESLQTCAFQWFIGSSAWIVTSQTSE